MTHPSPSTRDPIGAHEAHDRIAVAAYACGDAEGSELATATALVAACAECASLHRDLRAIASATAATKAPARPRDFRITAEQAARLRPSGWRRLLAPLASPRFAFAGPLGGGLAAIGLAGILVAGGVGLPFGAAGGAAAAPELAPVQTDASDRAPKDASATMAPAGNGAPATPDEQGGQVDGGDIAITGGDTGTGAGAPGGQGGAAGSEQPSGAAVAPLRPMASGDVQRQDSVTGADGADGEYSVQDATPGSQPDAPSPVPSLLALAALGAGIAIGGLRLLARRVAA